MGRAVSSFDIAQLVEPIRLEREAKKKLGKYDRRSIIGSLIDEALFEFTSLEEQEAAAAAKASGLLSPPGHGSAPLQLGSFAGVPSWGEDLGSLGLESPRSAPSGDSFDFGNLAALEDDTLAGRARSEFPAAGSSRPPMRRSGPPLIAPAPGARPLPAAEPPAQPKPLSRPQPPAPQLPPARLAAESLGDLEYPSGKSKGGLIAVVVVLLAVVGAAGAYFGGVIPH
jgi:eukaryotic-like serine/threonine-protein kinase